MDGLTELYQELILDHNARPRNFGALAHASHSAEGINPLCGDQVTVYLQLRGDVIEAVQFAGKGCAISKASASLMTQRLRGQTVAQAEQIFASFHRMVTADVDTPAGADANDAAQAGAPHQKEEALLGKLAALAGVRGFPMRIKCATLAWHTFHAALHNKMGTVSCTVSCEDGNDLTVAQAPQRAPRQQP